ncbi:MAG: SBBP repeat-containing protein [Blastocatellia bacterium]|nr:SBBP repeat-containing protein [Blastocatellia bacterium]
MLWSRFQSVFLLFVVLAGGLTLTRVTSLVSSDTAQVPARREALRLAPNSTPPEIRDISKAKLQDEFGKLPLRFEQNHGQTDPRVKFIAKGAGYGMFLTDRGAVLSFNQGSGAGMHATEARNATIKVEFVDGNQSAPIEGLERLETRSNYFTGNDPAKWRTDVPNFGRVRYRAVYPGVDAVFYGNQGKLEYDFVVQPGADAGCIKLRFDGAEAVRTDETGNLVLSLPNGGTLRQHKPVIYQERNGTRTAVSGVYQLLEPKSQIANRKSQMVGFALGSHDPTLPLVIDPVLEFGTFLGGAGLDVAIDLAVDGTGAAYVTGFTTSNDFPLAAPLQNTNGGRAAFVTKLNPAGTALIYSTYLGGPAATQGVEIAVDPSGAAYLTGETNSDSFPLVNPIQGTFGGASDAFVSKLAPAGNTLVYSTYLGGEDADAPGGIVLDAAGAVYVAGRTFSTAFPTVGAIQGSNAGGTDGFLTKINPGGTAIGYSTYLGGENEDYLSGVAVDPSGAAYVCGETASGNYPTTGGAFQITFGGSFDGVVTKVNPAGTALQFSTFLGGGNDERAFGLAVDGGGAVVVTGTTLSNDFPLQNPLQGTFGGNQDAFVAKLTAGGTGLVFSTFLGGASEDVGNRVVLDAGGDIFFCGYSDSPNFPLVNPLQPFEPGSGTNGVAVRMNAAGSALQFSTFLSGANLDSCIALALANNRLYLAGYTYSTDFPVQAGLFPPNGVSFSSFDAFLARLSLCEVNATAGGPVAMCPNSTTLPLGGNTPGPNETGQWSIFTPGVTGNFLPSPNTPNAVFQHTGGTGPFRLRWRVTSTTAGCGSETLVPVTLTAPPTAFAMTGGGTLCFGDPGLAVGLAGSQTGVNYQLLLNGTPVGAPVPGTGNAISFGLQTGEGTYTASGTSASGTGCATAMTGSAAIELYPMLFTVGGGGTRCANETTAFPITLSGSQTSRPTAYFLLRDGTPTGLTLFGTGGPLTFAPQVQPGVYTIRAVDNFTAACPRLMTGSATIAEVPLPAAFAMTGGGPLPLGGGSLMVGLGGSETGVSYQLLRNGTPTGTPVNGTGAAISFGAQSLPGTYTAVGTTLTGGCQTVMTGAALVSSSLQVTNGNDAGAGSLRDTMAAAGGGDVIVFAPGVTTVTLTSGELVVDKNLTIDGGSTGVMVTRAGGAPNFRIFRITNASVSLRYLTISNGTLGEGAVGAAIFASGPLTSLSLKGCRVTANTAYRNGGIVFSGVGLTVQDCTFSNNSTLNPDGDGAGALDLFASGTLTISNSTFFQNVGGNTAIIINRGVGALTNCTIDNNQGTNGGALFVAQGNVTLLHCTVTDNRATDAPNGGIGVGFAVTVNLKNSLVFNNSGNNGATPGDLGGSITSQGYNFIGTTSGATITPLPSDRIGVDPLLGPLVNNGGPTLTRALLPGSPAINPTQGGVPAGGAPATDQRGVLRDAQPDSGAYEAIPPTTITRLGAATVCAGAVQWRVTFPQPTSGLSSANLSLLPVGVTGATLTSVTPNGPPPTVNWTVTAGTGTGGGGTLGLQLTNLTGLFPAPADTLPVTGETYTINALPGLFAVTGGGSYCSGGAGVALGLAGSQTGVTYQLLLNGVTLIGTPLAGTGAALTFGNQTLAGTYTVRAANVVTGCQTTMTGSATVSLQACGLLNFILVADTFNNRIQKYENGSWSVIPTPALNLPEAVACDSTGQTVYVADTGNNKVIYTQNGGTTWNDLTSPGQVSGPQGLALDGSGNLYLADTNGNRVLRFTGGMPSATPLVLAGPGSGLGQVTGPRGLAFGGNNRLYIADRGNNRILMIPNANGTPGASVQIAGKGSGSLPFGQVLAPESVALDSAGNLYVADTGNNRVIRFANGNGGGATVLCTISGNLIAPPLGQVRGAEGVTVATGTLLGGVANSSALIVADTQNQRIQGTILGSGTWTLVGTPNGNGSAPGQFRSPGKLR